LLLTTDKNMRYQQNLSARRIAIVVLGKQQWPRLRLHIRQVVEAVDASTPGNYTEVELLIGAHTPAHGVVMLELGMNSGDTHAHFR
jgi:hypothetical protein